MSASSSRSLGARLRSTTGLLRVLVPRETRIRYRTSLLDVAWAFLTPLALLAVYGVVLTSFGVEVQSGDYLTSAWIGLVLWTYFSTVLGSAVTSLVGSADLVTKVYFPREALPLATSGAALLDLGIGVASVLVLFPLRGGTFGWSALLLPLPLLVIVVWSAALAVLTSVSAVFLRDLVHGVHLALRVGFFATPVVYDATVLPDALRWTEQVNPVAVSIEGVRAVLLGDTRPDMWATGVQLAAGLALLGGAVLLTRRLEADVADAL